MKKRNCGEKKNITSKKNLGYSIHGRKENSENSGFSALKGNPKTNRNNKRVFLILYNGEYFFEGNMLNVVLKVCE